MVVGGRGQFNYEFIPKRAEGEGVFSLPFLAQTMDIEENNLYPFLHLSSDGNLFIFARRYSILLDYKNHRVLRTFPRMPHGGSRNYPSTGSSVMLPLSAADNFHRMEILICGGAPRGTFTAAMMQKFKVVFKTCGRLEITSPDPVWQMEKMPGRRILSDMLILLTGDIILINGAQLGSAGYQNARSPVLSPFLYKSTEPVGKRFKVLAPSRIPRMYHSTASVLPDGRVLVAGSNPNYGYHFTDVPFSTELRVEAYIPYYLDPYYDSKRPTIHSISARTIRFGSKFTVGFSLPVQPKSSAFLFHAYAPPFTTHSFSMNQRMLSLRASISVSRYSYAATLTAPPSPVAAPSGYYMVSVVNGDVPSKAEWIRFVN
ncbi:aldehyde oxidase GLOX1 [Cryptomeria japonica]|uniref:aldehyde oxidase GLOX1 n=1 Tax=Cryptomeria japonica TaxID=3369 RepID=UPI0027DA4373|nr:aldehyde oxidase GLOX1 [Cryptomeria japonica]